MMQGNQCHFLKWVKIRIGEPLTAIEIDEDRVLFGSISGYVGYFSLSTKDIHYFEHIYEEIIRGIYSTQQSAYIAVGDKKIAIQTFNSQQPCHDALSISRPHSNIVCSHTMTMMQNQKIVIFCALPTQKSTSLPNQLESEKNNLWSIDMNHRQIRRHSKTFTMGNMAVPFDFDGKRVLWMQYRQDKNKLFQYYDLQTYKIVTIKQYPPQYYFLSHGKLVNNQLIFVENNKNIKKFNLQSKVQTDLYSHYSSIIALSIMNRHQSEYTINSVDFNGVYKEWKGNAVIKNVQLWKIQAIPKEIIDQKYLFDMGYAYYVKRFGSVLAITTDLGLCIFNV